MRYEQIGTLCVSGFICLAGMGIGYDAVHALMDLTQHLVGASSAAAAGEAAVRSTTSVVGGLDPQFTNLAMGAVLASFAVKEWLYRITVKIGRENNSSVLIANAWHHRSDALSSGVAAVGIFGSGVLGVPVADPIGGVVVAGMVVKTGLDLALDAASELADKNIVKQNTEMLGRIVAAAETSSKDVVKVPEDMVKVRKVGNCYFVELELLVSPRLSLSGFQYAQHLVTQKIRSEVDDVAEIVVNYRMVGGAGGAGDAAANAGDAAANAGDAVFSAANASDAAAPPSSRFRKNLFRKKTSDETSESKDHPDGGSFPTKNASDNESYSVSELQLSLKKFIETSVDDISAVRQVDIHFLPPLGSNRISAEIVIVSDLKLLSAVREQARKIRELVMTEVQRCDLCTINCAEIANVEVRLELSDGCHLVAKEVEEERERGGFGGRGGSL